MASGIVEVASHMRAQFKGYST